MAIHIGQPTSTLPNGMLLTKISYLVTPGAWMKVGEHDHILLNKPEGCDEIKMCQITFKENNFAQSEYVRRMIISDLKDKASEVFIPLRHNQMVQRSEIAEFDGVMYVIFDIMEVKRSGYRGKTPNIGHGILYKGKEADEFMETVQNGLIKYHKEIIKPSGQIDTFPPNKFINLFRITTFIYYSETQTTLLCELDHRYTSPNGKMSYQLVKGEDGTYHIE